MNPLLGGAAMLAMIASKVGAKVMRSQPLLAAECARSRCAAPPIATTARAMHVDAGVAPLVLAFLAVNGACAVPVTPAQLGVQEAAITVAFAAAGIPAPAALACALGYRCAHLVPLALVGVPALIATWAPARRGT
jgi:hypothetical protein